MLNVNIVTFWFEKEKWEFNLVEDSWWYWDCIVIYYHVKLPIFQKFKLLENGQFNHLTTFQQVSFLNEAMEVKSWCLIKSQVYTWYQVSSLRRHYGLVWGCKVNFSLVNSHVVMGGGGSFFDFDHRHNYGF